MARAGRGQVLLPWPNRLQDGTYEFEGVRYQLALTEPEHWNAIHGLVGWASWHARVQEPHRVVLEHVVHPQPGYPFTLEVGIDYELGVDGLAVRTTATNVGEATCPYGCGAHPYLTVGTELDFRTARRIAETKLDNGYMDLERDEAGLCRVELTARGGSSSVTLWVDETYPYLMVFTGDRPDVQRRGLAVEPMTCPPNAFRSGDDLIRLDPGASVTTTWGIATA
jgi:aldose 1-epimerase